MLRPYNTTRFIHQLSVLLGIVLTASTMLESSTS
jgi:hypothetical protein